MSWHGEEYADAVAIGGASARIQLYSITNETQFFAAGTCGQPDGILGMQGIGDGSLMTTLAATGMPQVFAILECGTAGMLWLGGFDRGVTTAPPTAYVPMVGQYTVTLKRMLGIGGSLDRSSGVDLCAGDHRQRWSVDLLADARVRCARRADRREPDVPGAVRHGGVVRDRRLCLTVAHRRPSSTRSSRGSRSRSARRRSTWPRPIRT